MDTSPTCLLCVADVFHCHEVSVVHTDGTTACGDPWCTLPHHLHEWQVSCRSVDAAACACIGPIAPAVVSAQSGGRRYTDTWWSLAS